MALLRWFTKNWADTREPTHPDLRPLTIAMSPDAAAGALKAAVAAMPRWRIERETLGELKLTRRTGIIGFVDDVAVTLAPTASGTIIHAASKSRVGIGDFGQNRRNILELWKAVEANL